MARLLRRTRRPLCPVGEERLSASRGLPRVPARLPPRRPRPLADRTGPAGPRYPIPHRSANSVISIRQLSPLRRLAPPHSSPALRGRKASVQARRHAGPAARPPCLSVDACQFPRTAALRGAAWRRRVTGLAGALLEASPALPPSSPRIPPPAGLGTSGAVPRSGEIITKALIELQFHLERRIL